MSPESLPDDPTDGSRARGAVTATGTPAATTALADATQDEKQEVKGYFETTGFDRWNRIYSDSSDVNRVQRNIRIGHQKTVDAVLALLQAQGNLENRSFCDAGCGVGSLSLPLASLGAGSIAASDLSEAMVQEAGRRASEAGLVDGRLRFSSSDLESIQGRYDSVICLDVFIHYPQEPAEQMVRHLASLAERHLIVSFAPYTPLLALLKSIGQLFPGPSRTTRAYTLREQGIVQAAQESGFVLRQRQLNKAPFYFSRLLAFEKA